MLKKNDIKLIRALRLKKYRQKYNKFIVEGEKIAIEAIKTQKKNIVSIYHTQEFIDKNPLILDGLHEKVVQISEKQLSSISNLKTANSIVILLEKNSFDFEDVIEDSEIIVYLDTIMDPGNMGTIIRTCEWFNINSLVVSKKSVDIYNPKVIQASMGSIFRLPILVVDFDELYDKTKNRGFTYYGTLLEGVNMTEIVYKKPLVIVIGNESHGISDDIKKKIDIGVTIPRFNNITESLNAAVATGIVISDLSLKIN